MNRILELAIQIQQIPAPTFGEAQRAVFVMERFRSEGLAVDQDDSGNVYARVPGGASACPIIVSAHLDTVFPLETSLTITRNAESISGPGIGDNSLGVAGLFGLLWLLRDSAPGNFPLPGDVWLVANVAEEGLGDLRGMKAVVDRFGPAPRAYIVLEGLSLGQVYCRALAVTRYRITVQTTGGHSWVDFGRPSAIHELSRLVARLTALPLSKTPRSALNVGLMGGGTSVNTIAPQAWCELDLRSEHPEILASLAAKVETLVKESQKPGVNAAFEVIGQRPSGAIPSTHPLVQTAISSLQEAGIQPRLNIGSTDANIPLSRGYPAICIGLTSGSGAHTVSETIQIAPLGAGMQQLVGLVQRLTFNVEC